MTKLADIQAYVNRMAYLTAVALDMEVLICDASLKVLGDYLNDENGICEKTEVEYLRSQSAITHAITGKKKILYDNAKVQNPGCAVCSMRDSCNADSILAYPILQGEKVLGAIGIYSNGKRQRHKLVQQKEEMLEFIEITAELIVAEYEEAERKKADILKQAAALIQPVKKSSFDEIIGSSRAIQKVKEEARTFAVGTSNILIQGESGTGKEVFANAIHQESKYANGPFIAVNCAAIPDNLLESELFGYEEGSFTGAAKGGRIGKFEMANHGTLFLDEIGELPIHLQPKLLRAIQERKIQRVGSAKQIEVDIRIISATNRDLRKMIDTGEFREDLFYRLGVIPIEIPPLRERKDDIAELAAYFLRMYADMLDKPQIAGFEQNVLHRLCSYDWPGNVRELQNTIEYAVNKCKTDKIELQDIANRMERTRHAAAEPVRNLEEVERELIQNALEVYSDTQEGKAKAAEALGISRATLYRKISKYQL